MTELSLFWNTNNIGDGAAAGFGRDLIAAWIQKTFARGGHGILPRILNELAVSGSSSPLAVASGAALVDGLFYRNSAALNLTVTTPSVGTTGGRVILRASRTAQTVRAAILMSADGTPDLPALTQTPGGTYEISLASFQIQTGGSIINLTKTATWAVFSDSWRAEQLIMAAVSVLGNAGSSSGAGEEIAAGSDNQILRRSGSALGFGQIVTAGIADDAITAAKLADGLLFDTNKLVDGVITAANIPANGIDDLIVGARVPQFYRRQGGSATSWLTAGSTAYTPGAVRMAGGAISITIPTGYSYGVGFITLPFYFANYGLMVACIISTETQPLFIRGNMNAEYNLANITIYRIGDTSGPVTVTAHWLVIGPE